MISQDLQKIIAITALGILLALLFSHATVVLAVEIQPNIIFSEIMYDVPGGDSDREWVEIYNNSDQSANITEQWRFWDGSSHLLSADAVVLAPRQAAVIVDDPEAWRIDYPDYDGLLFDSVVSLRNDGEEIRLSFDGGETWLISTIYDNQWAAGDGYSLVWQNDQWQQSDVIGGDPGVYNIIGGDICNCPVIICPTDNASEINNSNEAGDQDNDSDDDTQQNNDNHDDVADVNNDNIADNVNDDEPLNSAWQAPVGLSAANFYINELWPNPPGADSEAEFIELYNSADISVNLEGWRLEDNGHDYDLSGTIESGHYLVIDYSLSHLSLNNSGENIALFDPNDSLWFEVTYDNSGGENSYSRNEDNVWQWVEQATPGEQNYIPVNKPPVAVISGLMPIYNLSSLIIGSASNSHDEEEDELTFEWLWGDGVSSNDEVAQHQYQKLGDYQIVLTVTDTAGNQNSSTMAVQIVEDDIIVDGLGGEFSTDDKFVTINELRNMDTKTEAIIRGVIVAPPGLLATRYFYVSAIDGQRADPDTGIQIYYSGNDLSDLSIGDVVEVGGTLSQSSGEQRLKISQASDLLLIDKVDIAEPSTVATGEINDDWEGALVKIQGQLVKKQGSSWYVDDGSGEIRIYFSKQAGITKPDIDSGAEDQVLVTGVVSETSSGFRILPRYDDDINIVVQELVSAEQSVPKVSDSANEQVVDNEPIVPVADANDNYIGYGVALAGFSLVSWVVKAKFL